MKGATRRAAVLLLATMAPALSHAAGGGVGLLSSGVDLGDKASLQRGAKYFMNYCAGCHGLSFMRYKRVAEDLGIPEDIMSENLIFGDAKIEQRITTAMDPEDASEWFGVAPPDLSVIARARGTDWLYSYLVTFYRDASPSRPFGVNNVVFPEVGMPHVLWQLQGRQELKRAERPENMTGEHATHLEVAGDVIRIHHVVETDDDQHISVSDRLEVVEHGAMSPGEYRRAASDLAGFLTYVGEPAKLVRYKVGFWVLAFLAVFFVLTRALYKEYWRDVH